MNYQDFTAIEPGKRGGKPCIRAMRITTIISAKSTGREYSE